MNIVLLSGGSGKRLWPLSNETQSKQFLRLLRDDSGKRESMVQRVHRQIKKALPNANILVALNAAQQSNIERQLGNIDCILEPMRRDTFPAIVLAAAYLHYEKGESYSGRFVVCPIDAYADLQYFETLSQVESLLDVYSIGLMGAKPTIETDKYGYIMNNNEKVTGFKEKPDRATAKQLIAEGALWNCGVFALSIGYVLEKAHEFIEFETYGSLLNSFEKLPKKSFDYVVLENEKSIGLVRYDGMWKDLGSWNTLTEELEYTVVDNNVLISDNCENTHVINMLDKPIIALGLNNLVVVASHDGILVAEKNQCYALKSYADKVDLRPMYEQRRWGTYRVLEYKKSDSGSFLVKRVRLEPGKAFSYQTHEHRSESWVIISGKGILTLDEKDSVVSAGCVVTIPRGAKHCLLAATDLELIEVQLGDHELLEEDVKRFPV